MTLYFLFCFGLILLLKKLFLAAYDVEFYALSKAVVGALIVGKVVVVLDHTKAGDRFQHHLGYLNVIYKSAIYTFVVLLVGLCERLFHAFHDTGDFQHALREVYMGRDLNHFLASIICIGISFVIYNVFSGINRHMGDGKLLNIFFSNK